MITGEAGVDDSAPSAADHADYVAKYDGEISRQGFDPAAFAGEYSVPIRIRPSKLRAW